ncbi:hypothetical protein POJ06DRAFT_252774 [Lipomyces tetrasporus]|uniref:pH-response regulator protein palF/RIM8 n=1 Tax=Lipomyces tetrasporus TaxID=54092 RepID=A0AAD7QS64_9ASCO|nr:uncharacterized protein POJ06DRAFT_252774 [Lipomyces tetrasporus]KAJ8100460.1 hypothetical protein POJ06DRAFT_252774 [Lipomyces tetrasporus]
MKKALARLRPSLSALASPLAGFDEFYIVLDEPHRVWAPGDSVSGAVVLDLPKPVRTFQLRLRLLGQLTIRNPLVKGPSFRHVLCHEEIVLWDAGERDSSDERVDDVDVSAVDLEAEAAAAAAAAASIESRVSVSPPNGSSISPVESTDSIEPVRQSRRDRLLGSVRRINSSQSVPSTTSTSASSPVRRLPKGEHTFAFMFELPAKGLMTSLEFEKGSIVYMLTASHHRPGPFPPITCHKLLSLQCPLDVADLPPPKPSMLSVEIQKKNRRRERGTATAIVETPAVGCLRGEVVPVKVTVRHVREVRNVTGVVITLLRISRVCAHDLEPLSFRKDLVQTVAPLYIDSRTLTTTITANIRVPTDIFPTIDEYPLVAFKYCLEVVLDLSGKVDLPLSQNVVHSAAADTTPGNAADLASRPYVDTELLKRMKGVVSLWTEIVVGTERSEQIKLRPTNGPARTSTNTTVKQSIPPTPREQQRTIRAVTPTEVETPLVRASSSSQQPVVPEYMSAEHISRPRAIPIPDALSNDSRAMPLSPPPPHPDHDEDLPPPPPPPLSHPAATAESEKERLARMEEALLPSAPPVASGAEIEPVIPTLDDIEIAGIEGAESSSSSAAPRPTDKLEHERVRLRHLESAPSASTSAAEQSDVAPGYYATAPPRHHIEAYGDEADGSGSDCTSEEGEGDWVPMYSPNAEEEYVSMGGYHHYILGYSGSYDINDTTNVPYEHSVAHNSDSGTPPPVSTATAASASSS